VTVDQVRSFAGRSLRSGAGQERLAVWTRSFSWTPQAAFQHPLLEGGWCEHTLLHTHFTCAWDTNRGWQQATSIGVCKHARCHAAERYCPVFPQCNREQHLLQWRNY